MADQLASPADLAKLLQRDLAELDAESVALALEVSTAVVQVAAGQRILLVVDDPVTVWGGTDRVLRLPERPVVSVASVTYNGVPLAQGTASGNWRMAPDGLWRDCGWTPCPGEPSQVDVIYTHGYDDTRQEIQLARGGSASLARVLFVNPDGTVREQIDDYAVAYGEAQSALAAAPGLAAMLRRQYGRKAGMVRVL